MTAAKDSKDRFLLDTSALFAYFTGEAGAARVREIIQLGEKGTAQIFIPFVVMAEVYYISFQEEGEEIADLRYVALRESSATLLGSISEPFIITAAKYKASYTLSLADALIASYAFHEKAVLVHKDPEYIPLRDIRQELLPMKAKV